MNYEILQKLFAAFPRAIVNHLFEFIANPQANTYFRLEDCKSLIDVQCKVIAWLSRAAYKTQIYGTKRANEKVHKYHLDGINHFLGTSFTTEDMEQIYTYLGNDCNRPKCEKFIQGGYDMSILVEQEDAP